MKITLRSDMSLVAVIEEYANISLCNNSNYVIDLILISHKNNKRKFKLKSKECCVIPSSSEQQEIYGKCKCEAELIVNL